MPAEPDPEGAERLAVHLEGFAGPLDLLLDLARSQKVDLARISILALVEQYLAVIEGARRVRLELAADWLVMAAWLAWLKSRLLLPAEERAEETEQPADLLALRLAALDGIRRAAAWLGQRPRLGQDVFARGQPEDFTMQDRSRLAADLPGLLRAVIAAGRRAAGRRAYVPAPMTLWSVQDALARLERLLGSLPPWTTLERFLPELPEQTPLARRAAYASTLLAGLELARTGRLALRQEQPFGPIEVGGAG
jgi:segregation and condensation protein A